MCVSTPKPPPPPPPPAPPAPPPPSPELKDDAVTKGMDPTGMNRGRRKLRIDLASGAGNGAEGTGLNIPS
jgi:hypothetical protein